MSRQQVDKNQSDTHWRDRPFQTMQAASEIVGISSASLYRFAEIGRIQLRRLAGRTLVETSSLIEVIDSAEPWTPSNRGKEARAKRRERAQDAWQE